MVGNTGGGQGPPCGCAQGFTCSFSSWPVPSPPPPPIVKKPLARGGAKAAREAEAEPAQEAGPGGDPEPTQDRDLVRSSDPAPRRRAEPSREIRNIIRMYQSRPGPVPVPVQPSRWVPGVTRAAHSPGSHPVDS